MRKLLMLSIMLAIAGCAGRQGGSSPATPAAASSGDIIGTPAPGSKFSRVQIGMPIRQVQDLIGPPNDTASHITGKAFIPFYFGGDSSLTETFYKGEGQLSFAAPSIGSTNLQLVRIIVDPNEKGYAH